MIHELIHECNCVRCGEDHRKEDTRTITPMLQAFANEAPSDVCVGCFMDIKEKFVLLMMHINRIRGMPKDVRNYILMWIMINET